MKSILSILWLGLFCTWAGAIRGQSDSLFTRIHANRSYDIWLFATKADRLAQIGHGALNRVTADTIALIRRPEAHTAPIAYPVDQIDQIWLRRKNSKYNGALIGTAAALLAVAAVRLTVRDDEPCGECWFRLTAAQKAGLSAIAFIPAGIGIGIGVGATKIKIPIHRKKERFLPIMGRLQQTRLAPSE